MIGSRLDKVLTKLGYTKKSFAEELEISPNTLTEISKGRTKTISLDIARTLMQHNVNMHWLLEGEGPMFSDTDDRFVQIPLLGTIPAGSPAEAIEYAEEHIPVARDLFRRISRPLFALRVKGDSMTRAYISEGDIVVLEFVEDYATQTNTRDIVAALIDGQATLKRLYKAKNSVTLKAENPNYPDIVLKGDECSAIRGRLVALIRLYSNGQLKEK